MNRNSVLKGAVILIAIVNIVGILLFYHARSVSLSQDLWTAQESSAYVSTSYNVDETEEKEVREDDMEKDAIEEGEGVDQNEGEDPDTVIDANDNIARDPTQYPTLELTTNLVILQLGENFNYLNYLKSYQDVDGSDLSRVIRLDGNVNTNQRGNYAVTYSVTSKITGQTTSAILEVQVQ